MTYTIESLLQSKMSFTSDSSKLPPLRFQQERLPISLPSIHEIFTRTRYTRTVAPISSPVSLNSEWNHSTFKPNLSINLIKNTKLSNNPGSSSSSSIGSNSISRSISGSSSSSDPSSSSGSNFEITFVNLLGKKFQKRPRRRYHEVRRQYTCDHPNCDKSYGALNHLNAHIRHFGHGRRRRASEFRSTLS